MIQEMCLAACSGTLDFEHVALVEGPTMGVTTRVG